MRYVAASALSPRLFHGVADDADPHLRVEGTAVVVDISGFTTLSEQLAAAGREGTEQLIATLSRIFTVLLPVTDDGGDVVKFAGDALFVLFTGPDHARHAAHAAWNMNRVLAAIGDIHLPAARAKLRMSVGLHSGVFEFFLTGAENVSRRPHRPRHVAGHRAAVGRRGRAHPGERRDRGAAAGRAGRRRRSPRRARAGC